MVVVSPEFSASIVRALSIAQATEVPQSPVLRQQSHDYLEQISVDASQLPHCWQWFLELTAARDSRTDYIRFWCLQACDRQIKASDAPSGASMRREIAQSVRSNYFETVNPDDPLWIKNRAISVYVALIAADYPHTQPDLVQQLLTLVTKAPPERRPAAVDIVFSCLLQLDDTVLADPLAAHTEADRSVAMRIKDGMREGDVRYIMQLVKELLSTGAAAGEPPPSWWVDICEKAIETVVRLSVWADLSLIRDPTLRSIYSCAFEGKLPTSCARASIRAIQAMCYKRMHPLAKLSLINDYNTIDLVKQALRLHPSTQAKEYGVALGQAIGVIGLQLVEAASYVFGDMAKAAHEKKTLEFKADEISQFQMAGLNAVPSIANFPLFAELATDTISDLYAPMLTLYTSANLVASEAIAPFPRDLQRFIRAHVGTTRPLVATAAADSRWREIVARTLSACFGRIMFPSSIDPKELAQYPTFELEEDDGSMISEFFVCRKNALNIFSRAFTAALTIDAQIAIEFCQYCVHTCVVDNELSWASLEATLTLFAAMLDAWRDFSGGAQTQVVTTLISIIIDLVKQTHPDSCSKPDFVICELIDCLHRTFSLFKYLKGAKLPDHELYLIVLNIVLPQLLKTESLRVAQSCIRCLQRAAPTIRNLGDKASVEVIWQSLIDSQLLIVAPLRGDSRFFATNYTDETTVDLLKTSHLVSSVITTEDQLRLFEFLGSTQSSQPSGRVGEDAEETPTSAASSDVSEASCRWKVSAHLVQAAARRCLFQYLEQQQVQQPLQRIELLCRQAKSLQGLFQHRSALAEFEDVLQFAQTQLGPAVADRHILAAALPLFKTIAKTVDIDVGYILPLTERVFEAFLQQYQDRRACASNFELIDDVTKVAAFFAAIPCFLAKAVVNPSTQSATLHFLRVLVSGLHQVWLELTQGGVVQKIAGSSECFSQIAQIHLAMLHTHSTRSTLLPNGRSLAAEAFCVIVADELANTKDAGPQMSNIIQYLEMCIKDYQCDAVMRGWFEAAIILTDPATSAVGALLPVLLERFCPELVITRLLRLPISRLRVAEQVGCVLKFIAQGILIDRPEVPQPRAVPSSWQQCQLFGKDPTLEPVSIMDCTYVCLGCCESTNKKPTARSGAARFVAGVHAPD